MFVAFITSAKGSRERQRSGRQSAAGVTTAMVLFGHKAK